MDRPRLQALRKAAGLTQERAAERAQMSRNHYQLLEAGLSDRAKVSPANPRLSTLLDLAVALRCEVADLVAGIPDRSAAPVESAADGRGVVVTARPSHPQAHRGSPAREHPGAAPVR